MRHKKNTSPGYCCPVHCEGGEPVLVGVDIFRGSDVIYLRRNPPCPLLFVVPPLPDTTHRVTPPLAGFALPHTHMTGRGLSCVIPTCGVVWASLHVLIFLSLNAVGFRAATPWVSRKGIQRDTCVEMVAWRGEGGPSGAEQEAANRINLAAPCSRKDLLQSVSLGITKIFIFMCRS